MFSPFSQNLRWKNSYEIDLHVFYQKSFKLELPPFEKVVFTFFNESPLKMKESNSYFELKSLFILEIFTFLSWRFGCVEKWLDKKTMVNFKIYGVTDCTRNITIYILSNTSRLKDNQKMKPEMNITREIYFFKKMMQKFWWRSYSQTLF